MPHSLPSRPHLAWPLSNDHFQLDDADRAENPADCEAYVLVDYIVHEVAAYQGAAGKKTSYRAEIRLVEPGTYRVLATAKCDAPSLPMVVTGSSHGHSVVTEDKYPRDSVMKQVNTMLK